MLDFPFTQGSFTLGLYCFSFFLILVVFNFSACTNLNIPYNYSSGKRLLFLFGVAVFAITCFINGDFYHYQEMVHSYDFSEWASNHGEPVYGYIIQLVNRNYLLFRIVVWGGALFLVSKLVSQLGLEDYKVVFYLLSSYILTFSYARATLAFSIYYLGVVFCVAPNNRSLLKRVIGIALILISYSFHHSLIIAIAITPIIFIPFNKRTILLVFILIPIIFGLFSNLINSVLVSGEFLDNEELASQISFYAERSTEAINWKGKIYEWSNFATFFVPLIIVTYYSYFKNKIVFPFYIEAFFKIAFSLILFAVMFLFLDIEGKVFFYRVLFMTFIPLSIIVYYTAIYGIIKRKMYLFLLLLGLSAQLYRFIYSMYLYI